MIGRASAGSSSSQQVRGASTNGLWERFDASNREATSILQATEWPQDSRVLAQDLLNTLSNSPKLQRLPRDRSQVSPNLQKAVDRYLVVIANVCAKLKKAAKKYGGKKDFTSLIKNPFASLSKDGCAKILQECRTDVEQALAGFPEAASEPTANGQESPVGSGTIAAQKAAVNPPLPPAELTKPPEIVQPESSATASPAQKPSTNTPVKPEKNKSFRRDGLTIARKTFKSVDAASGMIPVVGSYVGGAAKVGLSIVELIQNIDDNEETAEDLANHTARLSSLLDHFKTKSFEHQKDKTSSHISEIQKELESVRDKVAEFTSQSKFRKAFSATDTAESLAGLQDTIKTALEEMQLLVGLNTLDLVSELYNSDARKETRRLLDRLGDASYGARGDAIDEVICLPGTRVEILQRIDEWIRDRMNSERVLWIRGMAGRGKSTIASTVAYEWRYRAVCAVFHFRRGENQSDKRLICAIARQLGSCVVPEIKDSVLQVIRENEDIAQDRLRDQFGTLLVGSLEKVQSGSLPILIVVDALDECEDVEYAVNFVKLIDEHSPALPDNVKFVLTSRPEAPLLRALEPRKWHAENLDTLPNVDEDVARFVKTRLSQIRDDHGLPEDWPAQADVAELVHMSQGLFQWARTALKYIGDRSPVDTLSELLESPSICDGLDLLYLQILTKAFEKVRSNVRTRELFFLVLGTLLASPYSVSLEVVGFLLLDQDALKSKNVEQAASYIRQNVLLDLNSLLVIPTSPTEPVRLMHTSVRDLLVDHERCGERPYHVNLPRNHIRLTVTCLKLMDRDLKENICKLSDISKPRVDISDEVKRPLSSGLRYCCRSWATHFVGSALGLDVGASSLQLALVNLKRFSENRILHWLEVMSLLGFVKEAIEMARETHSVLQELPGQTSDTTLTDLWNDASRFLTSFNEPISLGPLHIYASALPFCPTQTKFWERYGRRAKTRILHGSQPSTWPLEIWSRSAGSDVSAVVFSPDSKVVISGARTTGIQFWHVKTGVPTGVSIKDSCDGMSSIALSPTEQLLASGSDDKLIRLWDTETGLRVGEPLSGHQDRIHSVVFSPDGSIITSGSRDCTVRLWEVKGGEPIGDPLSGHKGPVRCVAISPDGSTIASASNDETIRLWDMETKSQIGDPLVGHGGAVCCVTFSPDGTIIASGSEDCMIRLWSTSERKPIGSPLIRHTNLVYALAFSPDGKILASGSYDDEIRLWNVDTCEPIGEPLRGHTIYVLSLAFSPDGRYLVSGGGEGTVRVWDAQADLNSGEPSAQDTNLTLMIAFSPNHKVLAYNYGSEIQLWDIESGTPRGGPLLGNSDGVRTLVFSPNGEILASGSHDNEVRIWNVEKGVQMGDPLNGHSGPINALAFSPDGKTIASGSSYDGTFRLWDVQKKEPIGDYQHVQGRAAGKSESPLSIAFTADGQSLEIGGKECVVIVNRETLVQIEGPERDHSDWVHYAAISSDAKTSISYGCGPIPSWDPRTCPKCRHLSSKTDLGPKDAIKGFEALPLKAEGQWITYEGYRLFWLPSEYWDDPHTKIIMSRGKLLFVTHGVLSIFDLSRALGL